MPPAQPKQNAATRGRSNVQPQAPFAYKLVLHQWLLSLFNVKSFSELAEPLRSETLEGLDDNNIHRFHHVLVAQRFCSPTLPPERLLEYDDHIVRHTRRLNDRRLAQGEAPIVWKYFQYLALLFTEIYLDRYFGDAPGLLAALNAKIATYNDGKPKSDQVEPLGEKGDAWPQLNKLAFWMATGAGKTLLMHANILQYQHALYKRGRGRELNRVILLTPNEGLSQQHLREFRLSGVDAELFKKGGRGLFGGRAIEILEVTRLRDEMGEKTVAIEAFEGNNLVLVDEGHRGASSGEHGTWMRYRNALCEKGFSFEYSATFGQAVKGEPKLTDVYAKSTLFDYSYRYFYGDGFGKDYQILNLDQGTQRDHLELYLVAGLLSFYQQQRLYREQSAAFAEFHLEKPLWVFVGGSVTATLATRDGSDIVEILRFFSRYVANRAASIACIDRVLNQGLVTANGRNLFAERFKYLTACGLNPAQVFDDTLATLFHAPAGGELYVENLKGATGEVALRIGADNQAFGVVNVGDAGKLVDLCQRSGLQTGDCAFVGSLFHDINQPDSTVNLLIGSKKFTEGWSSWRVSTLGLMNVGKGEGAQIIQLFGRGVRLKGYAMSLKRSMRAALPDGVQRPECIAALETLGIFGIHADYMAQFRDFLAEEGLPTNDERIEFLLPVLKNLGTRPLKTIRQNKGIDGVPTEFGDAFRKLGPMVTLAPPDLGDANEAKQLADHRLVLNWYPKIQSMRSAALLGGDAGAAPHETNLDDRHVAFVDLDRVYFALERYKTERGWHKLNLTRSAIEALLRDKKWYRLLIPQAELAFTGFEADGFGRKVHLWEEIAVALLKKYTERFYTFRKRRWEMLHLECRALHAEDPNFLASVDAGDEGHYRILLDQSRADVVARLNELKASIGKGEFKPWEFQGIKAVQRGRHLKQPMSYLDSTIVEISPAPLSKGESVFVEDLEAFYDQHAEEFRTRQLYLLRNLSKGRGVGFFEAGNFHPDFLLWLVDGGRQRVVFVDPKGIRNLGPTDPKLAFHQTIQEIAQRLGDPSVQLRSFIVSNTPSATMQLLWNMSKAEMNSRNVLFQDEDKDTYIAAMLR